MGSPHASAERDQGPQPMIRPLVVPAASSPRSAAALREKCASLAAQVEASQRAAHDGHEGIPTILDAHGRGYVWVLCWLRSLADASLAPHPQLVCHVQPAGRNTMLGNEGLRHTA